MNWKRIYVFKHDKNHVLGTRTLLVSSINSNRRFLCDEDWVIVRRYAAAMRRGARFPMIDVGWLDGHLKAFDGNHRLEACRSLGIKRIPVVMIRS